MPEHGENPYRYAQVLRVGEPWLTHVLMDAVHAYRQQLEREITCVKDERARFDLRLALCETGAAQEQLLAITIDEIGRRVTDHGQTSEG